MTILGKLISFEEKVSSFGKKRGLGPHDTLAKKWVILLLVIVVLNLVIFSGSIFLMYKINSEGLFGGRAYNPEAIITIDENNLKTAVEYLAIKKQNYEKAMNNEGFPVDPSL